MTRTLALSLCFFAFACGTEATDDVGGDPGPDAGDLVDADELRALPSWQLEDIQPASPRFGQTYGLDTFSNSVIVVLLAEGF